MAKANKAPKGTQGTVKGLGQLIAQTHSNAVKAAKAAQQAFNKAGLGSRYTVTYPGMKLKRPQTQVRKPSGRGK